MITTEQATRFFEDMKICDGFAIHNLMVVHSPRWEETESSLYLELKRLNELNNAIGTGRNDVLSDYNALLDKIIKECKKAL